MNPTLKKMLFHLKTKGPQTAKVLADGLNITSMGARQYLLELEKQEYVSSFEKSQGVGRPKLFWELTEKANSFFPDTHAFITTEIVHSIKNVLGQSALDKVIADRESQMKNKYQKSLNKVKTLEAKIKALVKLRSDEGYMADFEKISNSEYLLIENHCPICAAAKACQGFCSSELNLFQSLFPENIKIERVSHILSGAKRCAYQIHVET